MAAGKHPAPWTRLLRRVFRPFLSDEDKTRIAAAIGEAEKITTGEIHVHVIGRSMNRDMLALAQELFARLGLEKTKRRNGVLILVSHLDHRFAIYGDSGIHDKAGQHLWDNAAAILRKDFVERRYADGLAACVGEIGRELARHFPKTGEEPGDDELSNEVTES